MSIAARHTLLIFFLLSVFSATGLAQQEQKYFGQNKVQYNNFKWHYIQSEHFDIYFYEGGEALAVFTAEIAEEALQQLSHEFKDYKIQNRIPFIIYSAHNHFQQTNTTYGGLSEGTGGFTELFKNRIVLPYDGSYESFRVVIHHELVHAVMNDLIYGGSIQSVITGQITVQIPLWMAEGLANYEAVAFNTAYDMVVRDAVVEGNIPKIAEIGGFGAYTMGPTIWQFVEEKYGRQKIGEIITKMRIAGSAEGAVESALGIKLEELSAKWALAQRRIYFSDIANTEITDEFAKQLTRRKEDEPASNISPAISPKGDKIAYVSNKDFYNSIYLMSAIDGTPIKKLVGGETSPDLEQLHTIPWGGATWRTPQLEWSPDGKKLVFSSKSSDNDALQILDVESGKINSHKWKDMEGIFGGSWSPDGKMIVFTGMQRGKSDIHILDLTTGKKRKLTDDYFSDKGAVWSPDGDRVAFLSDRQDFTEPLDASVVHKMYDKDYSQLDVFVMNVDGSGIQRITDTDMYEDFVAWSSDGKKLAYTSDRTGISNIYVYDFDTQKDYAITNTLTGIFQLSISRDDRVMTFSSYSKFGFDIFTVKNPFEMEPVETYETLSVQKWRKSVADKAKEKNGGNDWKSVVTTKAKPVGEDLVDGEGVDTTESEFSEVRFTDEDDPGEDEFSSDYSHFVFGKGTGYNPVDSIEKIVQIPEETYLNEMGQYKIRKYKVKFSPDLFYGTAGFNTFFGFQGSSQIAFSDVLGNHRIVVGTNLFFDLKNSDFYGLYSYLPHRTDYNFSAFHTAYQFAADYVNENFPDKDGNRGAVPSNIVGADGFIDGVIRYRYFGAAAGLSRPFNKFNRADLSFSLINITREGSLDDRVVSRLLNTYKNQSTGEFFSEADVGFPADKSSRAFVTGMSLVKDNSLFTIFGPFDGMRSEVSLTVSPRIGNEGLEFSTLTVDFRRYFWFFKQYSFATRFSAGASFGRNQQKFFVGGIDNWINNDFANNQIIADTFEDFLATFVTPVRGSKYYEIQGTRYFVTNWEFRFPFVHYLFIGAPVPLLFQNIRGVVFVDAAGGWYDRTDYDQADFNRDILPNERGFQARVTLPSGQRVLQDLRVAHGFGLRMFVGLFTLRYDAAWNTMDNVNRKSGDSMQYFSLGYDF